MPARSQRASASLPVTPVLLQVEQRQVGVGAAGHRAHALGRQRLGQGLGVGDDLPGVGLVLGVMHSLKLTALARTACMSGPPCIIGKTGLVELGGVLGRADEGAAARAAQHLVGGEGDDVGVRHRARDRLPGDQADEVGRVDHEDRADLVGHLAERREVDEPRDRRAARDDHLGPVLAREVAHLVVVDVLGALGRRRSGRR
jgi:hypothetical protein